MSGIVARRFMIARSTFLKVFSEFCSDAPQKLVNACTSFKATGRCYGASAGSGSDNQQSLNPYGVSPVRSYQIVKPELSTSSFSRTVPAHIVAPNYKDVKPKFAGRFIDRKSGATLDKLRTSCALAKQILDIIEGRICVGMTTDEIDRIAHEEIIKRNAYPSPLHYHDFPKSVCTSVNNVACHGIPDNRLLLDGDIINVDVTVFHDGYHGDCSATFNIGNVDDNGRRLVEGARRCRDEAISVCGPGRSFSVIGKTISALARSMQFKVVPLFCGHGIGEYFHGPPDIYHFDNDLPGIMKEGMTFTIEPVISEGSDDVRILEDGWTAITTDDSRAAQFEHTILITSGGAEILTR